MNQGEKMKGPNDLDDLQSKDTYHYQMIRGDPNPASHVWNEEEISDVEKEKGVSNEEVRY